MAEPYKPEGRKVRGYNQQVLDKISMACKILDETAWERDVVKIGRAFKQAQAELDVARELAFKIETICAIAASASRSGNNGGEGEP